MSLEKTLLDLAIALGLGLLVGLQRERSGDPSAGVRTFAIIAVLGTLSALLALTFGGWILGCGVLALAALSWASNASTRKRSEAVDPGVTTEIAMLLVYALGAYLVIGERAVAVAVGGSLAVLLHLKPSLHALARRLGDTDFRAIMQFALLSMVILPVLPDRTFGPYAVLNPREVWWMVVLIVGISLAGYLSFRVLGAQAGTLLGGLLGGLISSTATTVSHARRTKSGGDHRLASVVILIASAVVLVRVLIEVAVVAPASLRAIAPPLAAMLGGLVVLAALDWSRARPAGRFEGKHGNPTELGSALVFGALYALVLLAVAAAKEHFGPGALYAVAAVSGLTDMDAITLSTAQLVDDGRLGSGTAWRAILIASLANLLFKIAIVATLGSRPLALRLATYLAAAIALGGLILLAWPW